MKLHIPFGVKKKISITSCWQRGSIQNIGYPNTSERKCSRRKTDARRDSIVPSNRGVVCSYKLFRPVISPTMVNRVAYPCFTEEQTEAWRLDHQPQGTWPVNSSAQAQSVLFQSPGSLNFPHVASLTAMRGDQVAPGSNFSSGSTPPRTHATLVGNSQWEINLCLQGPIIQSRRKRAMWAWAQAKHWLPLPLPLPVKAAGRNREGARETPTLVRENSCAWLSSNTKL